MSRFQRFWQSLFALQTGPAQRVIFYYTGEEPTFVEDAFVTVFRNGAVEVLHRQEHVSTHIQNVEILWTSRPNKAGLPGRALTLVKSDISK